MAPVFEEGKIEDDWSDLGARSDDNHSVKALSDWGLPARSLPIQRVGAQDSGSEAEESLEVKSATCSGSGEVVSLSGSKDADGVKTLSNTEGAHDIIESLKAHCARQYSGGHACPSVISTIKPRACVCPNPRPSQEAGGKTHLSQEGCDSDLRALPSKVPARASTKARPRAICKNYSAHCFKTSRGDNECPQSERLKRSSQQPNDSKNFDLSSHEMILRGGEKLFEQQTDACEFEGFRARFTDSTKTIVDQLEAIREAAVTSLPRNGNTAQAKVLKNLNYFCTFALSSSDSAIAAVGSRLWCHNECGSRMVTPADRNVMFDERFAGFLNDAMWNIESFQAKLDKLTKYTAAGVEWQLVSSKVGVHANWAAQANPWLVLAKIKENMAWQTYHYQGLAARVNMGELALFHAAIPELTRQLEVEVCARPRTRAEPAPSAKL